MIINQEAAFQLSENFSCVFYKLLSDLIIISSKQSICANCIKKDSKTCFPAFSFGSNLRQKYQLRPKTSKI